MSQMGENADSRVRLVLLGTVLFSWIVVIMVRLIVLMTPRTVTSLSSSLGIRNIQFSIAVGVIIVGVLAFLFKRKNQLLYGITEICFGIVSAVTLATSALPSEMRLTQWASLVGCVYVVARGLANVSDALRNPSFAEVRAALSEHLAELPGTARSRGQSRVVL